ncbi:MAG: dienelactone hydrolase family protein [Candidatus Binatia bacterium]
MKPPAVQSEMMQYAGANGTAVSAYLSRPVASGRYPGVVVIMEAFGLVEHIKDVARRFAAEGYVALAPDMYTREGAPDPTDINSVRKVMFSVPDSQAMGDLDAAAVYLKSRADVNGKVGAIGFCSGGRYALMFGCTSKNVDATVDSAGGFIIQDEHTPQRLVSPIAMIASLSCPLLGLFGEEDPNPSPAHAERLKAELDKHGKTYELRMYPHAGHAFFADYRPTYRAAAAQDMWHRVLRFYERYLQSPH